MEIHNNNQVCSCGGVALVDCDFIRIFHYSGTYAVDPHISSVAQEDSNEQRNIVWRIRNVTIDRLHIFQRPVDLLMVMTGSILSMAYVLKCLSAVLALCCRCFAGYWRRHESQMGAGWEG